MLHPVLDHMYPTGGRVPSCAHPGITNPSTDAASRFMSLYSCTVWLKQHWVLKTKGHLVLLKMLVFRGRTKFPYCCNSKHRERELPCSGGAQFSPQLAAGGCQSLHWEVVHQNAVSGPPHPAWSRLQRGVQRRVLWGGGAHPGCVHQNGVNWYTLLQRNTVMLKPPERLVNMSGQKTRSLSGRYLCALKPFNVPVNTAAQNLRQSGFPRRDLSEIKVTVSADWERTWIMAPEEPLKDRSSEPFRHLSPLKSERSEHFNNWGNLGLGLAFSKHHHILNS